MNAEQKAIERCIKAVKRFRPRDKAEWEIRYWVVKERLVKSLQRIRERAGR